jgi:hypothetical protein
MGKISWKLSVEGKATDVEVNAPNVEDAVDVDGLEEWEDTVPANKTKQIPIHSSQSSNQLRFLLIQPALEGDVENQRKALAKFVTYSDCLKGPWKCLVGPQLFVNGSAGWFPNDAKDLWFKNDDPKRNLNLRFVIGLTGYPAQSQDEEAENPNKCA